MRLRDLLKPTKKKTMAVPMAHMEPAIHCVDLALKENLASFILLGKRDLINEIADKHGYDISSDVEIIEVDEEERACAMAVTLVREGHAKSLMKGLAQTATFLRSLLNREAGLVPPGGLLSQVSFFDIPKYHKALAISDPGINILPDLQQKVRILQNVLAVTAALGIRQPKVACVAPVETISPKIPSTTHAAELAAMRGVFGDAIVAGPFAFDVAMSREAAEIKNVKSPVAGDADVLLMPELNCGNAVYKSLTLFGDATVAGMIAGLKVPVVLTSRADSKETKLLSMKLAFCVESTAGG